MKRVSPVLIATLFFLLPLTLMAIDATVEINGPAELVKLKPGIEQSLQARLIAQGINPTSSNNLTLTITQLGESLSFDAILAGVPPKAFHKDIKGVETLSPAIDEMLAALFGATAPLAPLQKPPSTQVTAKTIELPFLATSITTLDQTIYISDRSAIYMLQGEKPVVWWKVPDKDTILRISAYQDSIMVLTNQEEHTLLNHPDRFVSYRIRDGRIIQSWNSAVLPTAGGLISAVLKIAPDITFQANRWSLASAVDGQPTILPAGTDIIATIIQDIEPLNPGPEIISFSPSGKLRIANSKETIWASEASFATLPLSLQEEYVSETGSIDSSDTKTRTQYYFLPPRIIVYHGITMTIDNNAGLWGVLENAKVYKSSQIRSYTWTGTDFDERILYKTSLGYCTDITVQNDTLLALIVRKKVTLLTFTSLQRG